MRLQRSIADRLICPFEGLPLNVGAHTLQCSGGHQFRIVDGIPVILRDDVVETHWHASQAREAPAEGYPSTTTAGINDYVQGAIGATGGYLYRPLVGRLTEYPIPAFRVEQARGQTLLDIGCNWGRWSIAAARAGYKVVGIDPSLPAVQAAYDVARQLNVSADFLVADARFLPFEAGTFDAAFSYSVLQHFSKPDVRTALAECARVLSPDGWSLIQMANAFGLRSIYHQAKRGFREPHSFQVRYWSPRELEQAFSSSIGPSETSIDGFFTLNAQPAEAHLLALRYQLVVKVSELLTSAGRYLPQLRFFADSLYVSSRKSLVSVKLPTSPARPGRANKLDL